mmetsp:Transcript_126219/g.392926  ORF Transcript_126219/g.392926 Transcript_126219/m.392926 type:complete len:279 (-) Transcript_126219:121-957(-)
MRILRPRDDLIKELVRLATQRDFRNSRKRCVVAGTKLVRDLGRRYAFHRLLSSKENDPDLVGLRCESLHVADVRSLRRIAQLTDFSGIVGTLDLPMPSKDLPDPRLLLCLDYIEDPGLLGTLLRTAVAFRWQAAFFLPNCVDPFHPTCVRASQGALFEIPHCRGTVDDLQRLCKAKRLALCASHSDGTDIGSAAYGPPKHGIALLLREEYSTPWGPPRSALKIKVPDPWLHRLEGPSDGTAFDARSLDVAVAGGILMHHIKHFHYPWVSQSSHVASPH